MLTADRRLVGVALLVEAIVPLGDMSIILGSGGSKSRALSIHGVTCGLDACHRPLVDPCALREMLWAVLVCGEGPTALGHQQIRAFSLKSLPALCTTARLGLDSAHEE